MSTESLPWSLERARSLLAQANLELSQVQWEQRASSLGGVETSIATARAHTERAVACLEALQREHTQQQMLLRKQWESSVEKMPES